MTTQPHASVPAATPGEHPLPGWTVDLGDADTTMVVLERAFDYRGDVELTLASGGTVSGYLFDRKRGAGLADSNVRVMDEKTGEKIAVKYADIRRIAFSPRDPAAGKSFETWVAKYIEKKKAGLAANIESEPLE